jgi:hypothetical protein
MIWQVTKRVVPVLLLALVAGVLLTAAPAAQARTMPLAPAPAVTSGQAAYVAADWRDRDGWYRTDRDRDRDWRWREQERDRLERERIARERWEREHHRSWDWRDGRVYNGPYDRYHYPR